MNTNKLTAAPLPASGPLGRPIPGMSQPSSPPQQTSPPTRDQIEDAISKAHYFNENLRALLNKPGGASRSDVIDETGRMISEGRLSSQSAAQEIQSLPDDNGQIAEWLKGHIVATAVTRGKLLQMLSAHGAQQRAAQAQMQQQPSPAAMSPAMPPNALTRPPNG